MEKRNGELDDSNNGEERAVFIDTSLNTRLVLLVSHFDTFSHLKQKILLEHSKCFPDFGEIKINALKVKRKGCYYHLLDSMLVKVAFHGVLKNWFLFVDASSEMACVQACHALVPARLTKSPATLVDSSKLLKANNHNFYDHFGLNSYNTKKKSHPEMPKILGPSRVHDECNSLENCLKPGGSGSGGKKRRGRKKNDEDDNNVDYKTLRIEQARGDGDVQSLGIQGRLDIVDVDDHGKILPSGCKEVLDLITHEDLHVNSERKQSSATEIHLKSVGNDTKFKNIVDDETFPASPVAEKKCKVVNDNAQEIPLLDTRSVISDSNRLTSEPEIIINKNDGEDMQNSGLVDLNVLLSKVPKTSKVTGKRKMREIPANHECTYSDINKMENLKDTQHHAQNTDAVSKVESVQGSACVQSLVLHLEDAGNKHVKDVQKGAYQPEGTNTSLPNLCNNEKGVDNVELARGSRSKKTKKVKKGDVDRVDGSHPTASRKVSDVLKNAVSPSENENRINDNEHDKTKATGAEKTIQLNYDPKLLSQQEPSTPVERQIEEEIAPLKSLDVKGIVESENTAKKKKIKKAKNSVIEKSELCSTENHQDTGNHTSAIGSAEDNNRHCPTNEVDIGEEATQTDKEKPVNEIVELGNAVKKQKVKKGKNSAAEKPNLPIKENSEGYDKLKLEDKADTGECVTHTDVTRDMKLKTPTISSQNVDQEADDMRKIGAESLQSDEIKKPGEDEEVKSAKLKKRVQKKQTHPSKDRLEFPLEEQLGEKTRDPQAGDDPLTNSNANGTERQRGEDHHKELKMILSSEISTGVAEGKKLDKPNATKKKAKKSRVSEKTENATQLQDNDRKTEDARKIEMESLQPSQVVKTKENVEIRSDKPMKSAQRKQIIVKNLLELPVEKQLVEETSEMVLNSAVGDFMKDADVNDSKHQREVSVGKNLCEEFNDISVPEVSAGMRNLNKTQASKRGANKLDVPSSVDTSCNGHNLIKMKNSKGTERASEDGTELSKSTSEHKPWSSAKRPRISKQGMESQARPANSVTSEAKVAILRNQNAGAKKAGIRVASMRDGSKSSAASSVSSGSSVRRDHHKKKAKELQKKPDDIHLGSRRPSHKNMGEVVDAIAQRKGLLVTPGAIFEEESDASSDGDNKMDGSGSSTRTPSDYLSSSDYSEGESGGIVVISAHDSSKGGEKNTNTNMLGSKRLTLESILRSSSRYKKAKLVASQSQMEDGESQPVDFVPDSQAN